MYSRSLMEMREQSEKEKSPARQSIVINVGGSRFETFVDTLKKRPRTMLANLSPSSPYYRESCGEYFFDRDPVIFRAVLDFYRNQTLHFPHDVCGTVVRRELQYWKIDEKHVAPCCWQFFKTVSENQATVDLLSKALEPADETGPTEERSPWQWLAGHVWTFTEDPTSSRCALYYSYWIGVALLLSIFIIIFGNSDWLRVPARHERLYYNDPSNLKLTRFEKTDLHPILGVMEIGLVVFFMGEYVIRAIVSPDKRAFFTNILNVVEVLAVFPKAISMIIRSSVSNLGAHPEFYIAYGLLTTFDIFRVLRALKFGKYYVGLRVLIVTLRASALEMFFLVFLMVVGAVVFGVAMYFCEIATTKTVPDMSTGAYWAFITMATVGYGDVVPITMQGRMLAVVCALAGVLFTGLAVPIIANSFDRYYSQARMLLMRHRLGYEIDSQTDDTTSFASLESSRGPLQQVKLRGNISAFRV